jgi:very-short-patch-repair endonuclease
MDCGRPVFRFVGTCAHTWAVTPELQRLAARQHGLVTLAQVRQLASRSWWQRAHDRGELVPVHRSLSRLAGSTPTALQVIAAGALASGGLASHLSAAFLWGADVTGVDPAHVTVVERGRGLALHGVHVHRPTDVQDLGPVVRSGIRATNPLRTVLDAGAVCSPIVLAGIVETFLVQRYVGLAGLELGLRRHARQGRAGLGALRLVLREWALIDKPPDSVLELTMARLMREHGLPPVVFHHVVPTAGGRFELDFAVLDARVGIEVDGWAHHGSRRAFEADRARDAYLAGAGWLVLRFTWYQVNFRADWVAARIADALSAAVA